jgi:hypothetical protein
MQRRAPSLWLTSGCLLALCHHSVVCYVYCRQMWLLILPPLVALLVIAISNAGICYCVVRRIKVSLSTLNTALLELHYSYAPLALSMLYNRPSSPVSAISEQLHNCYYYADTITGCGSRAAAGVPAESRLPASVRVWHAARG